MPMSSIASVLLTIFITRCSLPSRAGLFAPNPLFRWLVPGFSYLMVYVLAAIYSTCTVHRAIAQDADTPSLRTVAAQPVRLHTAPVMSYSMARSPDILNATILIVDDQESNVLLLEQLLSEAGYTNVSSTMNPLEVCGLHRKNSYDLILLDLQLPIMDGFQVMEGLKTNAVDPYMSVVVLTAQPGHKLRALAAGAKDFISKPFDLIEVKTRIHNILEVRLLYKELDRHNKRLEELVNERTAELRESEARFRSLTELASDWYWEQDEVGNFTKVSGPVLEMLGIQVGSLDGAVGPATTNGWNEEERRELQAKIAARQPFLDFVFSRIRPDGSTQSFRVSGQPMFGINTNFIGYRGIGVELPAS